jgi:hypothetical protein
MGARVSREKVRYHHNGDRGRWYRTAELLDPHTNVSEEEETYPTAYFRCYKEQCYRFAQSSFALSANTEFQVAWESLGEDHADRLAAVKAVALSHYHDILSTVVDITDGLLHVNPVEVIPKVGRAYSLKGFFYFFWDTAVGDKLGRCELKASQHLLELQFQLIHVPLTYHLTFKGQGVTVQGLIPIKPHGGNASGNGAANPEAGVAGAASAASTAAIPSSLDILALQKEICSAFNLKPYEDKGRLYYCHPDAEQLIGLDGRIYFLRNYAWLPSWAPPARNKGLLGLSRFSPLRLELLATLPRPYPIRAYHRTAFVWENADAMDITRLLFDEELHGLTRMTDGKGSIIKVFRERGFNMCFLGFLLLSLLRHVTPCVEHCDEVLVEIFARGIKHYIVSKTSRKKVLAPTAGGFNDSSPLDGKLAESVSLARPGSPGSGSGSDSRGFGSFRGYGSFRNDGSSQDASFRGSQSTRRSRQQPFEFKAFEADEDMELDDDTEAAFLDLTKEVLLAFTSYGGHEVPRQATAIHPAVHPPMDTFGGKVVPVIYSKFRLSTTDVDFYRAFDVTFKYEVYQRCCELLGVVVEGHALNRVLPLVRYPGFPSILHAAWIKKRLEQLKERLLFVAGNHRDWYEGGPALALLCRQLDTPEDVLHCVPIVHHHLESQVPVHMSYHFLQTIPSQEYLEKTLKWRRAEVAASEAQTVDHGSVRSQLLHCDRFVLVLLLRKLAAIHLEFHDWKIAEELLVEAEGVCTRSLSAVGIQASPTFRLITAELIAVRLQSGYIGLSQQSKMIGTIVRYCEPDASLALDYMQLGVLQCRDGQLAEAEQSFLRARRILLLTVGEDHPLTIRCAVNFASLSAKRGRIGEAYTTLMTLSERATAPPDTHEALAQVLEVVSLSHQLDEPSWTEIKDKIQKARKRCEEAQAAFIDSHAMIPLFFVNRR